MEIQMIDQEEVWKCLKHPSKRARSGICARCLRERLGNLCPNCANVRPCNTCPVPITTSKSSSSFLLRFSSTRQSSSAAAASDVTGIKIDADRGSDLNDGDTSFQRSKSVAVSFLRSRFAEREGRPPINDREPNLIDGDSAVEVRGEPSIQRSRSVAVAFLRSRFGEREGKPPSNGRRKSVVWSILKTMRNKRVDKSDNCVDEFAKKTNSVGVRSYFPSPIRAFRHHNVVEDRPVSPATG